MKRLRQLWNLRGGKVVIIGLGLTILSAANVALLLIRLISTGELVFEDVGMGQMVIIFVVAPIALILSITGLRTTRGSARDGVAGADLAVPDAQASPGDVGPGDSSAGKEEAGGDLVSLARRGVAVSLVGLLAPCLSTLCLNAFFILPWLVR